MLAQFCYRQNFHRFQNVPISCEGNLVNFKSHLILRFCPFRIGPSIAKSITKLSCLYQNVDEWSSKSSLRILTSLILPFSFTSTASFPVGVFTLTFIMAEPSSSLLSVSAILSDVPKGFWGLRMKILLMLQNDVMAVKNAIAATHRSRIFLHLLRRSFIILMPEKHSTLVCRMHTWFGSTTQTFCYVP